MGKSNRELVFGFKAFYPGLINRYGQKYEINKLYHTDKDITFGNNSHAYHMCENLEDVYRYYPNDNILIAEVMGFGNITEYNDEYYGYYNMYACEYMIINKVLSNEDIMNYILNLNNINRVNRFLKRANLTIEEKERIYLKFKDKTKELSRFTY